MDLDLLPPGRFALTVYRRFSTVGSPFFICAHGFACASLRRLSICLVAVEEIRGGRERERLGEGRTKEKRSSTLFPNAFLAFSISRVPPPAAPFSFPFPRIRLRLRSFQPPREKCVFFQDPRIPTPPSLSPTPSSSFAPVRRNQSPFLGFSILHIHFLCCPISLPPVPSLSSSFVYASGCLGTEPAPHGQAERYINGMVAPDKSSPRNKRRPSMLNISRIIIARDASFLRGADVYSSADGSYAKKRRWRAAISEIQRAKSRRARFVRTGSSAPIFGGSLTVGAAGSSEVGGSMRSASLLKSPPCSRNVHNCRREVFTHGAPFLSNPLPPRPFLRSRLSSLDF